MSLLVGPPVRGEVSAWLRVARAAPDADSSCRFDADEFRSLKATAVELANAPPMLAAALRAEGVSDLPLIREQPDPAPWLASRLAARSLPDSELIVLRLDAEGEDAAKLLDAVVAALLAELNDPPAEPSTRFSAGLRSLLAAAESDLERQHAAYQQLASGMHALDRQTSGITAQAPARSTLGSRALDDEGPGAYRGARSAIGRP